jgi:hypothetical protein
VGQQDFREERLDVRDPYIRPIGAQDSGVVRLVGRPVRRLPTL